MNIEALEFGKKYVFKIKDWTTPHETVVVGQAKERVFVGHKELGGFPFIQVARDNGTKHLIDVNTIETISTIQ